MHITESTGRDDNNAFFNKIKINTLWIQSVVTVLHFDPLKSV